jgi:2',3'-cyclic-nucleotide 2'-phosphodiesterase (5'-nucleotidase family)
MRKWLAILVALTLALSGFAALAEEATEEHPTVVVLYTNDAHCGIEENMGYAGVMAYKSAFEATGAQTVLVDAGDAMQGGPVGTLSEGAYIIDIMNEMGYAAMAVGNHEFDYGVDRFFELSEMADFPFLSCNFVNAGGTPAVDAYTVVEAGGWKIAFVGVTTPETYTSSAPKYFQDESGNYIYGFMEANAGADLWARVQETVDEARADGADFVIALTHLGINAASQPFTSNDLIANTTGVDCVLDGHSHSVLAQELVKNAAGEDVILTSTGTKLQNLGALTISPEGELSSALHAETIFQDADMAAFIGEIKAEYEETLATVIGTCAFDLCISDPATGARLVRTGETNLGDLCADAYRIVSGADVALINGGGVRADIPAGDFTYEDALSVHPFGNAMCVVEVTGQQILDALEMGARAYPEENGGFWQVSGLTYAIDATIPSSVVLDEEGLFVKVDGAYRVKDVAVGDSPLDLSATYTLAGNNYHIKSFGDGMAMFEGAKMVLDETMLDNQVLISYIRDTLGGAIPADYEDPYGQGRIAIVAE